MTIDWNFIDSVNLDEIDDEKAELLYDQLIEFTPTKDENIENLCRVFNAAKCVMQVKALQADVAVEELEEMAKKNDRNELEALRKEVDIYRKNVGSEGANLLSKVKDYHFQIEELNKSLESRNTELSKLKRKLSDLEQKLEGKEKEIGSLKDENESLRDELDNQRQGIDEHFSGNQEPFEKLREKNKQIQELLQEMNEMETTNVDLAKQIKSLRDELETTTGHLQTSLADTNILRTQLTNVQELNSTLLKEKEYLMKEVDSLREALDNYEQEDDVIAVKFAEKVDTLLNILKTKEDEISKLSAKLEQQSSLIRGSNKETLVKRIEAKEYEINGLRQQLQDSLAESARLKDVIAELRDGKGNGDLVKNKGEDGEEEAAAEEGRRLALEKMLQLEEELREKDEELLALRKRNLMYEKGEYGLSEALAEVRALKVELDRREEKIEDLVKQLNEMSMELNDTQDELDYIRECAEASGIQTENVDKKSKSDKLRILKLQKQIVQLEDEKIALAEELRLCRTKQGMATKSSQKSSTRMQEEMLEEMETLRKENKQLELGMKEILTGLRESDANSDVVVDCPSLERLCQLLESRSLSSNLTNVIALKAELDLLRGHNQQLRMEVKRLRYEHLRLINQYTSDLLTEAKESDWDASQKDISEGEVITRIAADYTDEGELMEPDEGEVSLVTIGGEPDFENGAAQRRAVNDESENKGKETPLPAPRKRSLTSQANAFTQTDDVQLNISEKLDEESSKTVDSCTKVETRSTLCQTDIRKEPPVAHPYEACNRCKTLFKNFEALQGHIYKIEETILSSERSYLKQIQQLRTENENLEAQVKMLQDLRKDDDSEKFDQNSTKSLKLSTSNREQQVDESERSSNCTELGSPQSNELEVEVSQDGKRSSEILRTIIDCLKARINHKDESIKQYQVLLQKEKEKYEGKLRQLVEHQERSVQNGFESSGGICGSLSFGQIIDNDELQNALEKCVSELEKCKSDCKWKIQQLESEIGNQKVRLAALTEENEKLRLRSHVISGVQLRSDIDRLEQENREWKLQVEKQQKMLKDERFMRTGLLEAVKQNKKQTESNSGSQVEEKLRDDLKAALCQIESQKERIKELEIKKWDLEKKVRETVDHYKCKIKDKSEEIARLEKDLVKLKKVRGKLENQSGQDIIITTNNVSKAPPNKGSQLPDNKLLEEMRELKESNESLKSKVSQIEEELRKSEAREAELKILLRESVQREKLATICEDQTSVEENTMKLLKENAQLKVELRMTEYELKRKGSCHW